DRHHCAVRRQGRRSRRPGTGRSQVPCARPAVAKRRFSPAQIATMNFINSDWYYNSPAVSPNGMYEGYPISHVTDWSALLGSVPPSQWAANPFLASIAFETVKIYVHDVDPTADETTLSFNQIAQDIIAVQALPYKPYDYRSVRDGGGKMIEYSGFAD